MKKQRTFFSPKHAFIACLLLCFFASCLSLQFKKINPYKDYTTDHLLGHTISKLKIVLPDSLVIFPGASFQIGVVADAGYRKELKTRGYSGGYVNWCSYYVHVDGGSFDNGLVTVNSDPKKTGAFLTITVMPYIDSALTTVLRIPVSYKAKFLALCKGENGANGIDGLSGGELDQIDTTNDADDDYNGLRGQAGTDGENGADGCIVDAFVKAKTLPGSEQKIMSVLVINHCDNSRKTFWIDPNGGSLLIDVSGGNGGNGGNGGDGQPGANGIGPPTFYQTYPYQVLDPVYHDPRTDLGAAYVDLEQDPAQNPDINGADGGFGGNGGRAGNGGSGGVVIIHLDTSAVAWKANILVNSKGGTAGQPGKGGYAGKGGRASLGMYYAHNGTTGYVGADGIRGANGNKGSETIWRTEPVKLLW